MKRTFKILAACLAVAGMTLVSCQKEVTPTSVDEKDLEARDCFVASLDQSTKTTLGDSLQVKWAADDSIIVNGVVYGLDFIYEDSDSTRAEFSKRYKDDETPKAPFTAFFPAKWYDKAQNDIVVPKTLTWQDNNDFSMPMKAVTSTRTMTFENTYGVLAVKVEKDVLSEALSTITVMTSETDTVRVLECNPAQTIAEEGNIFYVPMAEGNYDSLIVYANSHEMFSRNNKDIEIKAGSLYAFNYRISLKSITLNAEDFQIIPGEDTTLTVTFDPVNATNQALIWTSTVDSVATVDSCGKLSAIKPGDTKIIVTSVEGAYKDSCTVTVKIPVDSVVFANKSISIKVGKDSTLRVKVWPEDATDKNVSWSSLNETVATVDSAGKVTGLATGNVQIVATVEGKTDTCQVSVLPKDVLLSGKFSVSATKQVQFTRGNLYWDGTAWGLESSQTDYPTAWSTEHVSHLFWTKDAANSYAASYNESASAAKTDKFFADGSDADHSLTIENQSGLYALSKDEWSYLINTRTKASSLYKYGVTVSNGGTSYTNCLIIAPDDFTGTLVSSYTLDDVNALGLVCLPAAGCRDGSDLDDGGSYGYFLSATPHGSQVNRAYYLSLGGSTVNPSLFSYRSNGYSVRLVYSVASSVPVYPEAPTLACVKIGDVWWAPVNCGYDATHTYGSLYQWGRKYGQPFENGTLSLTDMTKADDTEANKGKFGKYDSSTYNWFSGTVDNTLWNGSTKGGSDPCPEGWRVPTEAEFTALITQKAWGTSTVGTEEQTGYWFNGSSAASVGAGVFLPAAGCRSYNSGSALNRGSEGNYWSSSVSIDHARYLNMYNGEAAVWDGYRADSNSVRCVKE